MTEKKTPGATLEKGAPAATPARDEDRERVPVHVQASGSSNGSGVMGKLKRWMTGARHDLPQTYRDEDVTPIPPLADGEELVELRPVRAPFSYVRIVFSRETNAHRYEVIEPPLGDEEDRAYAFVKDAFLRTLDIDIDALDRRGAREYLSDRLNRLITRHDVHLSALSRARVAYYLERDFLGFGPIDAMMLDGSIEDISCDGPNVPLFIFHRKHESVKTNLVFPSDFALDAFVMQLVQRSGKHISVADPLVDATLPDGSRLQASLSREVTTRGSTFTIRKFRRDPFTPTDLVTLETASAEMVAYLWLAVEHGASGLICGGTASGKTTTLNALSTFIPSRKKIVSIEDTRELNLTHENWIPGVTRVGGSGEMQAGRRTGEVDMFDLLKAALRQRPEYLLLGEVRGQEAYVLFQAMATGHTVYSTMHADSVASAVHRLESRPLEIPRNMLANLDFVVIQGETRVGADPDQEPDRVGGRRVRKVREIVELTGIDPRTGELLTNRVFHWDNVEQRFRYSGSSFVLGRVADDMRLGEDGLRRELDRRIRVLNALQRKSVRDIASFSRVVSRYSIDPDALLAELEARA